MAEYPALPLFTDAYLADTRHLTTAQHGAYILMLMTAWRSTDCTLPNDDVYLARICGMDKRTWKGNKDTLLAFWQVTSDAKLFQKRLKDERKYVEQKRNINVAAGKSSALKRKERHSAPVQPDVNGTSTPTPTPLSSIDKSISDAPEGVLKETWDGYIEVRKKLKAANTDYAISLVISELQKLKAQGFDPQAVVEQSIRKSWKDVFKISDQYGAKPAAATETPKPITDEQRAENIRFHKKMGKVAPHDERWLESYEAKSA